MCTYSASENWQAVVKRGKDVVLWLRPAVQQTQLLQQLNNNTYRHTQRDSDVVSCFHIYASCFAAMVWGRH